MSVTTEVSQLYKKLAFFTLVVHLHHILEAMFSITKPIR